MKKLVTKYKRANLKKAAVEHYQRMQAWVIKQPLTEPPNRSKMQREIEEDWFGSDCPYCLYFLGDCERCNLFSLAPEADSTADSTCCNDLWLDMNCAATWKDWLYHSENVIEYIIQHG